MNEELIIQANIPIKRGKKSCKFTVWVCFNFWKVTIFFLMVVCNWKPPRLSHKFPLELRFGSNIKKQYMQSSTVYSEYGFMPIFVEIVICSTWKLFWRMVFPLNRYTNITSVDSYCWQMLISKYGPCLLELLSFWDQQNSSTLEAMPFKW